MNAQQVVNLVSHNQGGTFAVKDGEISVFDGDVGYAVSRVGSEVQVPEAAFGPADIEAYLKALPDGVLFGVWIADGIVYLDQSDVLTDTLETAILIFMESDIAWLGDEDTLLERAIVLGKIRNQKAIWSFSEKTAIEL